MGCADCSWYFPGSHRVHVSEAALAFRAQPRGQPRQESDPLALNLPAAHATQMVLPFPSVLCPAVQFLQLVWSVASVYVFCEQSSHSVMPCWLPYLPGTQGIQMAWPVSFWCLPGWHLVQLLEADASAPRAQPRGHALHSVDPADLNLPAPQAEHVVLPFPSVLSPNEHTLQLV